MKMILPNRAIYTTQIDTGLRVPNDGAKYGQIAHDWQLESFSFLPRQLSPEYEQRIPVPATRPLRGVPDDFMIVPHDWQYFIYDLLDWVSNGLLPEAALTRAYVSLTEDHRAFTDGHARENGYCDFVTMTNMGKIPYHWKALACTGNLVKIIGTQGAYFIIETLDITAPPPAVKDVINKPWLIHWATEQGLDKIGNHSYVVARFPQLRYEQRQLNLNETGTPYPLMGIGGRAYILKEHISRLQNGASYSPYVPEK